MPWSIWRLEDGQDFSLEGGVVIEEPLEIRLNGQPVAVLMRTPGLEKELAAGFCLGEGLVADASDIALVRHCGRAWLDDVSGEGDGADPLDGSRNRVDVTLMPGATSTAEQPDLVRLIRSGCGRTEVASLAEGLAPILSEVRIPVDLLPRFAGQITRQQAAYRAAGGIHAAAVFDSLGRAIVVCEDIGRHNAVDKAVGYCLLRGIPLQDRILVSTGRASYDMVAKGIRLGMPILASISSPTSLAVEMAEALNCTLLGYLRGKAVNVYTHSWRIIPGEDGSSLRPGEVVVGAESSPSRPQTTEP
jgi:FdhD protein